MRSDTQFEFGDFQTPLNTAETVVQLIAAHGLEPRSIIEPTCGVGNFLLAATECFPMADQIMALEINQKYAAEAGRRVPKAQVTVKSFFEHDWESLVASLPEPILIIGNPPWVTSSGLAARGATNLPKKDNFQRFKGLDAKTGKANFDIAEWMLMQLIESAGIRNVTVAMLLKTAVARKILQHAWKKRLPLNQASIYKFDAMKHFGVSAAACLLVCKIGSKARTSTCAVYERLGDSEPDHQIGWENGHLIANAEAHAITHHLQVSQAAPNLRRWRSGVKHDCSKVMELCENNGRLVNGLGETVDIEDDHLYPLMKGSDVAQGRTATRYLIVPQRRTGDETKLLKITAPKTWAYLLNHAEYLDRRRSSIYRNRPQFSVFGIGDYTFTPWKIAICGLYKTLDFRVVGPINDRPVVFDDTNYLLPFNEEEEARRVAEALGSDMASAFFHAFVFWDNKRPITADLLNRLDLRRLMGDEPAFAEMLFSN